MDGFIGAGVGATETLTGRDMPDEGAIVWAVGATETLTGNDVPPEGATG